LSILKERKMSVIPPVEGGAVAASSRAIAARIGGGLRIARRAGQLLPLFALVFVEGCLGFPIVAGRPADRLAASGGWRETPTRAGWNQHRRSGAKAGDRIWTVVSMTAFLVVGVPILLVGIVLDVLFEAMAKAKG
jgi:hypothetical protein